MRAGRRTQVVKGAVCKTAMQRFDPARRLQTERVRPHTYERGAFNSLDESHAVLPLQLPLFNEMMCGDGVP
jgi:hypothetical protein